MGYRIEANPFEEAVSQSVQARERQARETAERTARRVALWDAAHEEGMTTIERLRDVVVPALVVIEDDKTQDDLSRARSGSVLIKIYQRGVAFDGFRPERWILDSWIKWDADLAEASPDGHGWQLNYKKPEHGSTLEALLLAAVRHPDFAEELVKLRADPPDPPPPSEPAAQPSSPHRRRLLLWSLIVIALHLTVGASLVYQCACA